MIFLINLSIWSLVWPSGVFREVSLCRGWWFMQIPNWLNAGSKCIRSDGEQKTHDQHISEAQKPSQRIVRARSQEGTMSSVCNRTSAFITHSSCGYLHSMKPSTFYQEVESGLWTSALSSGAVENGWVLGFYLWMKLLVGLPCLSGWPHTRSMWTAQTGIDELLVKTTGYEKGRRKLIRHELRGGLGGEYDRSISH